MLPSVDQLKATLSGLPSADRAEIAHYLLVSLDEPAADDAVTAWHDELNRRVEEIQSGKAVGVPLEDAVADLRKRFP